MRWATAWLNDLTELLDVGRFLLLPLDHGFRALFRL